LARHPGRRETHDPSRVLEVPEPQPTGSAFELDRLYATYDAISSATRKPTDNYSGVCARSQVLTEKSSTTVGIGHMEANVIAIPISTGPTSPTLRRPVSRCHSDVLARGDKRPAGKAAKLIDLHSRLNSRPRPAHPSESPLHRDSRLAVLSSARAFDEL
jgi:hypothetical protein